MLGRPAPILTLIVVWTFVLLSAACSDPGGFDDRDSGVDDSDATDTQPTPDATDTSDTADEDSGPEDTGEDVEPDTGPCGRTCADPTPFCDAANQQCVACFEDTDCSTGYCSPTNECVECYEDGHCAAGQVCKTDPGVCVACLNDEQCEAPGQAQCDANNECVACDDDSQCVGVEGADFCVDGACVECTADDNSACGNGNEACDVRTNECTGVALGSVGTCGKCRADSECGQDHRCVPMFFDGQRLPDGYCLKTLSSNCERPYTGIIERESLSGAASEQYCGVDEDVTSCEAVLQLIDDVTCSGGTDEECGLAGEADARCETVLGLTNRCTYSCSADAKCPSGFTCGGPSGDEYCGGS